jgi:hypothetical protein
MGFAIIDIPSQKISPGPSLRRGSGHAFSKRGNFIVVQSPVEKRGIEGDF